MRKDSRNPLRSLRATHDKLGSGLFCCYVNATTLLLCMLCFYGCARQPFLPSVEVRTEHATALAKKVGWHAHTLNTADVTFKMYGPTLKPSRTLTIYIEGDGLAWLSPDTPSINPTPMNPIGLKLAIRDKKHSKVVYLARACQFVFGADWKTCRTNDWTNLRFSPAVVQATQQAINMIKAQYHAKNVILIGYSGGGVIAALVAASRSDVVRLITIASPLDTDAWVRQNNLTPLYGSLNPADAWQTLATISQTHWVGGKDTIVPKEVAFAYANRFPTSKKPDIEVVPGYDHSCCWATDWQP